jgi:hypothetical protein
MKPNNSTKMDQKNIGVYLDLCNYNIIYIFIEVIMKYKTILLPTLFFAMSSFTTVNAESRYDSNGSYTVDPGNGTTYQYNSDGSSSYTINTRGQSNTYNSDGSSSYSINTPGRSDTYNSDGSSSYTIDPYKRR